LKLGMVAVDPKFVPLSQRIEIPELEAWLTAKQLLASDVGGGVKKKHIDIYTGEGEEAKKLSFKVTGRRTVCLL